MCLLPSSNIGNEEMAIVKAIPNSQGNFELLGNIWPIYVAKLLIIVFWHNQDPLY